MPFINQFESAKDRNVAKLAYNYFESPQSIQLECEIEFGPWETYFTGVYGHKRTLKNENKRDFLFEWMINAGYHFSYKKSIVYTLLLWLCMFISDIIFAFVMDQFHPLQIVSFRIGAILFVLFHLLLLCFFVSLPLSLCLYYGWKAYQVERKYF